MADDFGLATAINASVPVGPRYAKVRRVIRFVRRNSLTAAAGVVLLCTLLAATLAPALAPADPTAQRLTARLEPPGAGHILGTDEYGRDVLSRLLYGARISLFVGFSATLLGVLAGGVLGLLTGYIGGWLDLAVQRVIDALMAIPGLVLLLSLAMLLGPTVKSETIALTIFVIPSSTRVVRSHVLSIRGEPYVEAARVVGASGGRVMVRHILPNVAPTLIVAASVVVGAVVLAEAGIGFLGMGVTEPTPTWGNMLSRSGQQFMEQAPWLAVIPGAAIALVVGAFNLFGDGLRDLLDPRLRSR